MRIVTWCVLFTAAACGLAAHSSLAAAAEPLRWKFAVGDTLAVDVSQNVRLHMDKGPKSPLGTTMQQTLDVTWQVRSVNADAEAVITGSIDRVQMSMQDVEQEELQYDSAADEPAIGIATIGAPLYAAMTAGKYEITVTARGEVRDVKMSDDVLAMLKSDSDDDAAKSAATVEALKATLTLGLFALPEGPPTVGQEWSTRAPAIIPECDHAEIVTTYRYEGMRDVEGTMCAVIRPTLELSLAGNSDQRLSITSQKSSGEVLFDPAAGRLRSMSVDQDVALNIRTGEETLPGTIDRKIEVQVAPTKD